MKIVVTGKGGREHAMCWKLKQSKRVSQVYCIPGNPVMRQDGIETINITENKIKDIINWCKDEKIDLVIPGSETALALGLVNGCQDSALKMFGPTKEAAQIESSKIFAKNIMLAAGIKTADAKIVNNFRDAILFINSIKSDDLPVIKADCLASGKGVLVPNSKEQAITFLEEIFDKKIFGRTNVLFEKRLIGTEMSVFALCYNNKFKILGSAQDYKRRNDNDLGPNTGGMGAISPHPLYSEKIHHEVLNIFDKTLKAMTKNGTPYNGILYLGLMLTDDGPYVLEFNARFGDPETQALLFNLDGDILDIIQNIMSNDQASTSSATKFQQAQLLKRPEPVEGLKNDTVTATLAITHNNYPYKKGEPEEVKITESQNPNVKIFAANISQKENKIYTDGGRVAYITAKGQNLKEAIKLLYENTGLINFKSKFFRNDIGEKWTK